MKEYTQKSTDSTLEFFPRQQEMRLVEPLFAEKHQKYCQIKNLGDRMQVFDSTLTTKQTEHAGLPFLPLFSNKEEGNGN
jgi:hypothetical protein